MKIKVCKKTCNYSENLGKKTPKNPRISWFFLKRGIGGELIYSDFANRWSMKFSCEKTGMKKNEQLFWKLGEKNNQKSKDFVSFPQKWNFFGLSGTNLFWFCRSLQCRFLMWKNEFRNKRLNLLNVVRKKQPKNAKICRFSPKARFLWTGRLAVFFYCLIKHKISK